MTGKGVESTLRLSDAGDGCETQASPLFNGSVLSGAHRDQGMRALLSPTIGHTGGGGSKFAEAVVSRLSDHGSEPGGGWQQAASQLGEPQCQLSTGCRVRLAPVWGQAASIVSRCPSPTEDKRHCLRRSPSLSVPERWAVRAHACRPASRRRGIWLSRLRRQAVNWRVAWAEYPEHCHCHFCHPIKAPTCAVSCGSQAQSTRSTLGFTALCGALRSRLGESQLAADSGPSVLPRRTVTPAPLSGRGRPRVSRGKHRSVCVLGNPKPKRLSQAVTTADDLDARSWLLHRKPFVLCSAGPPLDSVRWGKARYFACLSQPRARECRHGAHYSVQRPCADAPARDRLTLRNADLSALDSRHPAHPR